MAYDVTTIGSLFGSCECGKEKHFDPARMAGFADTAKTVFDALNPFSEKFFPIDIARRAGAAVEDKAQAAAQAAANGARAVVAQVDPLPFAVELVGIPTWGYQRNVIMGGALVVALGAGAVIVARKMKKKAARGSRRTRK